MAEAVEKVGATRILVTMIHDSGHLRNFDSMASFALNHCFKKTGTGDFFNSLGYTSPVLRPMPLVRCAPITGNLKAKVGVLVKCVGSVRRV